MKNAFTVPVLLLFAACGPSEPIIPTYVDVSESGACTVAHVKYGCESVGQYLRSELHISTGQRVVVRVEGTHDSELRGRRVASFLRESGYSEVAIVGFLSEPSGGDRNR